MKDYPKPDGIMDANDLGVDLRQLLGYVWAEGNCKRVFPCEHFCELVDYFLKKHFKAG